MTLGALTELLGGVQTRFDLADWNIRQIASGVEECSHEHYLRLTILPRGVSDLSLCVDVTLYTNRDYLIGPHHDYGE